MMKSPIADPNETPRFAGADARVFRINPWVYAWRTLAFSLIFSVPCWIIFFWLVLPRLPSLRFPPTTWLWVFVGASLYQIALGLLQAAVYFWTAPVKTSAWGFYAFAYWGAARQAQWSQVESVKLKSRWQIVPSAVATLSDGRRLYIPLCLRDMPAFVQSVANATAPAHPLRQFLQMRDTKAP